MRGSGIWFLARSIRAKCLITYKIRVANFVNIIIYIITYNSILVIKLDLSRYTQLNTYTNA